MNTTLYNIPHGAACIIEILKDKGYDAFVVGGCVRDSLLGREPHDWDICTNATPEEVIRWHRFAGAKVLTTGLKHGTVTVIIGNEQYEVTTYRIDGEYTDHRRPDKVTFTTSLEDDLSRRDFTVNAMAYNPAKGLQDPYGGACDLRMGLLRCVGDADQRFKEDALRILRALRFASTYQFDIETATAEAIHRNKDLLKEISAERVRDELCKLLVGSNVKRVLMEYRDVLAVVIHELEQMFGFNQNSPWHCYDVWEHTVCAVAEAKPNTVLRVAALLHDIAKPSCYAEDEAHVGHFHGHPAGSAEMAAVILHRLRFDNDTASRVYKLILNHDTYMEVTGKAVRKMLSKLGEDDFTLFLDLRCADILAQSEKERKARLEKVSNLRRMASDILKSQQALTLRDLKINGDALLSLGMKPGPEIGEILLKLLDAALEDPACNTKERLLELARSLLKEEESV